MTRELKFRVWHDNKMHEVYQLQFQKNGLIARYKLPSQNDFVKAEGGIVMQFTGLEDKSGKEIFEGDIVRVTGSSEKQIISKVIFDAKGACIIDGDYLTRITAITEDSLNIKVGVIGNIHENPDLLTT